MQYNERAYTLKLLHLNTHSFVCGLAHKKAATDKPVQAGVKGLSNPFVVASFLL